MTSLQAAAETCHQIVVAGGWGRGTLEAVVLSADSARWMAGEAMADAFDVSMVVSDVVAVAFRSGSPRADTMAEATVTVDELAIEVTWAPTAQARA